MFAMKSLTPYILLFVGMQLLFSCSKSETSECPSDLACTEVFVTLTVKIQNRNNESVFLTRTTTSMEGTSKIITKSGWDKISDYHVLDDLSLKDLKKSGSIVTFKGFDANNQMIVNEQFIIGHDCCHIVKISGKDVIIVN
jgi:hypothetical protein